MAERKPVRTPSRDKAAVVRRGKCGVASWRRVNRVVKRSSQVSRFVL